MKDIIDICGIFNDYISDRIVKIALLDLKNTSKSLIRERSGLDYDDGRCDVTRTYLPHAQCTYRFGVKTK